MNKYETFHGYDYDLLREHAKQHRQNQTEAEALMWHELRGSKLGFRFRRQHIVDNFIVDFVCIPRMLIIEIDGGYHYSQEQILIDRNRDARLEELGYSVLRFSNEEVINDMQNVLNTISLNLADK